MSSSHTDESTKGRYFPFIYLQGFLHFLYRHRSSIELITYDDLQLHHDTDHTNHYLDEYNEWRRRIRHRELDPTKIYLLLQHDVDREPARTHAALAAERHLGLRANVMIFNRKIDRRALRQHGRLHYSPYPLDYDELKRLQHHHSFVIGYHTNAVERSLFDFDRAVDIFRSDIEELRNHFDISYFSPHGGVRGPDGRSNAHLDPPPDLMRRLRWVQNRFTVRFAATFSDGAIAGVRRDPEGRDLRQFVKQLKPGNRYRVLLHPQYYGDDFSQSTMLSRADWYVDLCDRVRRRPSYDPWECVELEHAPGSHPG